MGIVLTGIAPLIRKAVFRIVVPIIDDTPSAAIQGLCPEKASVPFSLHVPDGKGIGFVHIERVHGPVKIRIGVIRPGFIPLVQVAGHVPFGVHVILREPDVAVLPFIKKRITLFPADVRLGMGIPGFLFHRPIVIYHAPGLQVLSLVKALAFVQCLRPLSRIRGIVDGRIRIRAVIRNVRLRRIIVIKRIQIDGGTHKMMQDVCCSFQGRIGIRLPGIPFYGQSGLS